MSSPTVDLQVEMAVAAFTLQELATILAALRYWQNDMEAASSDGEDWTSTLIGDYHFTEHAPLTLNEIDDLCERLNG